MEAQCLVHKARRKRAVRLTESVNHPRSNGEPSFAESVRFSIVVSFRVIQDTDETTKEISQIQRIEDGTKRARKEREGTINSRRQMPQPILKSLTQRRSQLAKLILQLPLHTLPSAQLSRSSVPSLSSSSSNSSSELNRLLVQGGTKFSRAFADDGFGERNEMFQGVENGRSAGPGFEEGFGTKDAVFGGGFFAVTEGGSESGLGERSGSRRRESSRSVWRDARSVGGDCRNETYEEDSVRFDKPFRGRLDGRRGLESCSEVVRDLVEYRGKFARLTDRARKRRYQSSLKKSKRVEKENEPSS